eukprot:TRINITY_DN11548_c0_g1_i1.p2 TRINITY_DN11548_c0_g1~~TRINITY_DN11548_c0_g1_i1.p2  ORF type:complete len:100 (-),score=25.76 TRINITY_DN11548_c0_g1_i1:85-384(-)
MMTFSVPLTVAIMLEATNQSWSTVFGALVMINIAGSVLSLQYTSTENVDALLAPVAVYAPLSQVTVEAGAGTMKRVNSVHVVHEAGREVTPTGERRAEV